MQLELETMCLIPELHDVGVEQLPQLQILFIIHYFTNTKKLGKDWMFISKITQNIIITAVSYFMPF